MPTEREKLTKRWNEIQDAADECSDEKKQRQLRKKADKVWEQIQKCPSPIFGA